MCQLRNYQVARVQSPTYEDDDLYFSVGIISPGEYEFRSMKKERFTVMHARIPGRHEGGEWITSGKGTGLKISDRKNFKLKADEVHARTVYYEQVV